MALPLSSRRHVPGDWSRLEYPSGAGVTLRIPGNTAAVYGPGNMAPPSVGHAGERFIVRFPCRILHQPKDPAHMNRISETTEPAQAYNTDMKLSFLIVVALFAASAWAQPNPWFYQPLGQVQQFLQLTDSQLQTVLMNNDAYNQFAMAKQSRISQVQTEIATETAKDTLDPMALGVRYAEIETICRDMKDQATSYQKRNTDILTDPQKAKLQVLQDAMKLAPVISDAQSGNLIGTFNYAPPFFTSASGSTTSGSAIGGIIGGANGCYSPFLFGVLRTGDFTSAPNGNVIPANRTLGGPRRR